MEKNNAKKCIDEEFHICGKTSKKAYIVEKSEDSITVEAVTEAMESVLVFLNEHLHRYVCDQKVRNEIRLAVEEIFVNICSYAYASKTDEAKVVCRIVEEDTCFQIQFQDTGIPFDPLAKEELDNCDQHFLEQEGGFGIHLVKQTMDEVSYEYSNGMNILKVKRFISK